MDVGPRARERRERSVRARGIGSAPAGPAPAGSASEFTNYEKCELTCYVFVLTGFSHKTLSQIYEQPLS